MSGSRVVRVLLTGGAGFLGRRVISELRDMGAEREMTVQVRSLDLRPCETADYSIVGDITDSRTVESAVHDTDVVIHAAAMIDWGNSARRRIFEVNVEGTRRLVEASRRGGARGLVYTGTMDAVMDGGPLPDIDESQPYPARFLDAYAESKALAEQVVLDANRDDLRTTVLRSCGMYGEADPYHMDSVIAWAKAGRLAFRIGSPHTKFVHVYVGNVAYAHALAAFALVDEATPTIAGRKYFVTDQPADNFFEFMRPFVEHLGYDFPSASRTIPAPIAMLAGRTAERLARLVRPAWNVRPKLTRSSVAVLTNTISIRSTRLSEDLGYVPRYSPEEAFARVIRHYSGNT